ncbi:class A sortase [Enterococcus faecalis]
MRTLWATIKYYKVQLGAIGVCLIALFVFFGFQSHKKTTMTNDLVEIAESGVKEAKKPKSNTKKTSDSIPDVIAGAEKQKSEPEKPKEQQSTAEEVPTSEEQSPVMEEVGNLVDGERPTAESIKQAQVNFDQVKDDILGTLQIPSIALEMAILQGDSFEKMLYGACTVLPKQTMGQGNYVLAAHNAGIDGIMFSSLPAVEVGETITISDRANHTYTYSVKEKKHVDMTDTSMLNLTRKPTLTLITCDQATKTTGRIVVIAELV